MKKVLIYSDCPLFGGSEHAVINLLCNRNLKRDIQFSFAYRYHTSYHKKVIELLKEENDITLYPVHLLTNYELVPLLRTYLRNKTFFRICFAPFYYLEKVGAYELVNRMLLRRILKFHNYDIVHINNGGYPAAKSCILMTKIAKDKGVRVILQVNNIADAKKTDKRTNNIVVQSVDKYITASQIAKQTLLNVLSIESDKILTIPHFVDYINPGIDRKGILDRHGIPNSTVIIVEVALLQKRKGQEELIRSIDMFSQAINKPVVLLLIGNGENKENIETLIKESEHSKNVQLLGYRDDYIDYLNAADIVTLPSLRDEDMPLTIISALSLGKPIVSSKLAGIPEEIEDGKSGVLVNPSSDTFISDLSEALVKAYIDKERLSANARARYEANFSKEKFENSYKQLYNSL